MLGPILCGRPWPAPLFPKLRGQFAEFLNNPSPVGLRILSSSTCVGLRYGRLIYTSQLFSPLSISDFSTDVRSLSPRSTNAGVQISQCVPVLKYFGGHGISTVCASTTPLGLALAPGLPWADEPSPRNLRFSAIMISHIILATHSGILTRILSTRALARTSPCIRRSPTKSNDFPSFGYMLSPVIFSAQIHSTSELLRTLLMCGCL